MQRLLRVACLGYVVLLSLLLFVKDPSGLIGCRSGLPWFLRQAMPSAHLLSFLALAVMTLVPRWPVPRWAIFLMLVAYGGMTEIVQGFIPPRTPEWQDWFQDLGGLALGAALCWGVALLVAKLPVVRHAAASARDRRSATASPA
jgi:VanZ family protein